MLIDSTQLDVLPNARYLLPKASMAVSTTDLDAAAPILFKGSFTTDTSSHIAKQAWDFGDGKISRSKNVIHQYKSLTPYTNYIVVYQVVDSRGFIANAGVKVDNTNGKLVFSDQNGHINSIPVSTNFADEAKNIPLDDSQTVPPWVVLLGLAVLFLGSAFVIQLTLSKR